MTRIEFSLRDTRKAQELLADMNSIKNLFYWIATNVIEIEYNEIGSGLNGSYEGTVEFFTELLGSHSIEFIVYGDNELYY
jgi:hypothetical protein